MDKLFRHTAQTADAILNYQMQIWRANYNTMMIMAAKSCEAVNQYCERK